VHVFCTPPGDGYHKIHILRYAQNTCIVHSEVRLEEERFDFSKVDLGHVPFIRRCRIEKTDSIDRPPEAQPAVPKKLMPKNISGLLHKWPIKRINRQHIP
jgi:hypothetical protein